MARIFRIHPAVGVARVGNSPEPGFIGPEFPGVPANWDVATGTFRRFKDDQHRIKRQGARFRVFEFDENRKLIGEAIGGQSSIDRVEWTVHVANKKGSFFEFHGSTGEDGTFSQPRRNAQVADRASLEIDPGPRTITGKSAAPIVLTNPNPLTSAAIPDLGDLSTDEEGRLQFFGGHGNVHTGEVIDDYVNNDGWFDDVSDGPVEATIVLSDGSRVPATGAWVTVGPPDFAPGIANVVSLYETMWDVAVRNKDIPLPALDIFKPGGALERLQQQRDDWDPSTNRFKTHQPSYVNDVAHLFNRAFGATWVHSPPDARGFHNTIAPQMWADLGDPDPSKSDDRQTIFKRVRDPNATTGANSNLMPRGLGDQYCDETENPADTDEGRAARDNARRFFSVTRTQYALLAQWQAGIFAADGQSPPDVPTTLPPITPEGLDRAALENCVGGPFYPGIEVSWVVRNPKIYAEPFRVRIGVTVADGFVTGPGFFTQQMALPWQADFRDCKREELTSTSNGNPAWAMWWSGQRPDDVYPEDDPDNQVPWTRAPHFTSTDADDSRFRDMVIAWWTLGFVARKVADGFKWLEVERSP